MGSDPSVLCLVLLELRLTDVDLCYRSLKESLVIAYFSFHFKPKLDISLPRPQSSRVLQGPLLLCLGHNAVHMKLLKSASIRLCHLF